MRMPNGAPRLERTPGNTQIVNLTPHNDGERRALRLVDGKPSCIPSGADGINWSQIDLETIWEYALVAPSGSMQTSQRKEWRNEEARRQSRNRHGSELGSWPRIGEGARGEWREGLRVRT